MTTDTSSRTVIVCGGGPVGLVTAMLLGCQGIACVVLDAATSVPRELRASTFHPPTLDMLEPFGITQRLVAEGLVAPTWQVRWHSTGEYAEFDLSLLKDHTRHPYRVQCEQWRLAEFLLAYIRDHVPNVRVLAGHTVESFEQDGTGVTVRASDPQGQRQSLRGAYLVGADGARSVVRSQLGLGFEGHTFPETTVLASTTFPFHEYLPNLSFINYCWKAGGTFSLLRLRGLWRASLYPAPGETEQDAVSPASIEAKLQEILPQPRAYEVLEIRPYRIHQRVVQRYVNGRVILAGDAAHINSPSGGMGMNGGIHDAFNLAEKLALALDGAGAAPLQLYERQRRPIAVKHVLEQSGRNRARMQERDEAKRREHLNDLQRKAGDPKLAVEYLLQTSMISGLREAAQIT